MRRGSLGLARVVQMRTRVKAYWPALVWAFTLLLVHVQTWGDVRVAHGRGVDVQAFAVTLAQPILLFFMSALALPDFDRDEALDLRANYFRKSGGSSAILWRCLCLPRLLGLVKLWFCG